MSRLPAVASLALLGTVAGLPAVAQQPGGYTATDSNRSYSPAPDPANQNIPSQALGAALNPDGSATFSFWSPFAGSVSVQFYSNWNDPLSSAHSSLSLVKGANGIWTGTTTPGRKLYTFKVNNAFVLDPYARSMAQWSRNTPGDSIGKGYLLDPATVDPDGGWTPYSPASAYFDGSRMRDPAGAVAPYAYSSGRDAIIYEANIRDFTVDPALTGLARPFGTYKAFIEVLPHIRNLGVTHIQLLAPLQNYYYDQTRIGTRELDGTLAGGANYNWGYDPQNYFTPSGMYSAAPNDAAARVNELKTLVNEIHKAGMGVLLDVVYNHTANTSVLDSSGNPGYYYRSGNASGTGNDVRTEAMMVRKLIFDSIDLWVREYRVDGFRFDLMGLIDSQTLTAAYNRARALNPKSLLEGEGWNMYNGDAKDYNGAAIFGSQQSNAAWFAGQGMGIPMFSDSFRDLFKSGGYNDGRRAFLSGQAQSASALFSNISGKPTNFTPGSVGMVMNYLTAHDNLCLYDVLAQAMSLGNNATDNASILKRMMIGYSALLTSQGTVFIHGGDEMFRSKELSGPANGQGTNNVTRNATTGRVFCHNSYNASDYINMVRWSNAYQGDPVAAGFGNLDAAKEGGRLYRYVQGLIALRKSTDAFRQGDGASVTLIKPN